jgi:hypothetical protein
LPSNDIRTPRDQDLIARDFFRAPARPRGQKPGEKVEMRISKNLLLGASAAAFMMESLVVQPALAADKVSLFKVVTVKDEILIGIPDDELAQIDGKDAGGLAKMLVAKGSMSVWQYAVHKSATGDLEQAPLRKVGLIASDSLRVEPYNSPLKVLPIEGAKK